MCEDTRDLGNGLRLWSSARALYVLRGDAEEQLGRVEFFGGLGGWLAWVWNPGASDTWGWWDQLPITPGTSDADRDAALAAVLAALGDGQSVPAAGTGRGVEVMIRSYGVEHEADEYPDASYLEQDGWEDRRAAYDGGEFSLVCIVAAAEVAAMVPAGIAPPAWCRPFATSRYSDGTLEYRRTFSHSLCGVESDSDCEYVREVERGLLRDLARDLREHGISEPWMVGDAVAAADEDRAVEDPQDDADGGRYESGEPWAEDLDTWGV